jgi:hypothetical protein
MSLFIHRHCISSTQCGNTVVARLSLRHPPSQRRLGVVHRLLRCRCCSSLLLQWKPRKSSSSRREAALSRSMPWRSIHSCAVPSSNFLMYFLYVAEPAGALARAQSSMVMKRALSSLTVALFSAINGSTGLRVLGVGVFLGILADSILVLLYSSFLFRRMSSAKGGMLLL